MSFVTILRALLLFGGDDIIGSLYSIVSKLEAVTNDVLFGEEELVVGCLINEGTCAAMEEVSKGEENGSG